MNLDQLIAHLEAVRARHGGGLTVMVGQRNPDDETSWSGVNVEVSNINETAAHDPMLSAYKQVPTSSGWLWFEFPKGGIQHPRIKPFGQRDVEKAVFAVERALEVRASVHRKLSHGSTAVSDDVLKECESRLEDAKALLERLSSDHPLLKGQTLRVLSCDMDGVSEEDTAESLEAATAIAKAKRTPKHHRVEILDGDVVIGRWDRTHVIGENRWRKVNPGA